MCDTNAYIRDAGKEEIYLESVARIEDKDGILSITGVFGDRKELKGRIREINFLGGRVILERM